MRGRFIGEGPGRVLALMDWFARVFGDFRGAWVAGARWCFGLFDAFLGACFRVGLLARRDARRIRRRGAALGWVTPSDVRRF